MSHNKALVQADNEKEARKKQQRNDAEALRSANFMKKFKDVPTFKNSQISSAPRVSPIAATTSPVEASNRPSAQKLPLELISRVEVGASEADVVAKLGPPPGKITGLGDSGESWSYVVEGGGFAKFNLENGKVTGIKLPR